MSTISDKVLSKINKEHIKPLPRWQFRLRNGGQWAGFGLLVILAMLSLGLLWYFWSDGPWLHGAGFGFGLFFGRMPLVLFGIIVLGGLFALLDFRHTGRGYRYSLLKIGLILLLLAAAAGWSLNYFGISQRMDAALSSSSLYQGREVYMRDVWQRPNEGLLAGKIIVVESTRQLSLRDLDGKIWTIDVTNALWRHNLVPAAGLEIKLIGSARGDNFVADDIRPWMGPGNCGMMQAAGSCGMMR